MRLPLEGLYFRLVRDGFPLSARDYEDALAALRLGYGTLTRADLQWLCENLWAQTDEEKVRLAKHFRDFPQPTLEAMRRMTGAREQSPGPVADKEKKRAKAEANSKEAAPVPSIEFAAAEEPGGMGLPQAAVPASLLQPRILTPRPAVSFRQLGGAFAWRTGAAQRSSWTLTPRSLRNAEAVL
jgi:hypothetical protein